MHQDHVNPDGPLVGLGLVRLVHDEDHQQGAGDRHDPECPEGRREDYVVAEGVVDPDERRRRKSEDRVRDPIEVELQGLARP